MMEAEGGSVGSSTSPGIRVPGRDKGRRQEEPSPGHPKSFREALRAFQRPDFNLPDASRICAHEIIHHARLAVHSHSMPTRMLLFRHTHLWFDLHGKVRGVSGGLPGSGGILFCFFPADFNFNARCFRYHLPSPSPTYPFNYRHTHETSRCLSCSIRRWMRRPLTLDKKKENSEKYTQVL